MSRPILFETTITKQRIIDAIEDIESEIGSQGYISDAGVRKLRELRLALESKPVVDSVQ